MSTTPSLILYTTSMMTRREIASKCQKVKQIFDTLGIVYEERDVSQFPEFLKELKQSLGSNEVQFPQVFYKEKYLGGFDTMEEFNEKGELKNLIEKTEAEYNLN